MILRLDSWGEGPPIEFTRIQPVPFRIYPSKHKVLAIALAPSCMNQSLSETEATLGFYCRCSSHDEIQAAVDAVPTNRAWKLGLWISVLKKYCPNLKLSNYRSTVQRHRRLLQRHRRSREDSRRAKEDRRRSHEDRRRAKENHRRMGEDHMDSLWWKRQERLEQRDMAPEEDQEVQEEPGQFQVQWEHEEQGVQQDVHDEQEYELQNGNREIKAETGPCTVKTPSDT